MPIHLLKLAVGIESVSDLASHQTNRLAEKTRRGEAPELIHVTRQMPRRGAELLAGGSIYWVIQGFIAARQRLVELRPLLRDGIPHCGLVYEAEIVPVVLRPHRAFQGWRYLDAQSAPPDLTRHGRAGELPEELKRELAALGLL